MYSLRYTNDGYLISQHATYAEAEAVLRRCYDYKCYVTDQDSKPIIQNSVSDRFPNLKALRG